MRVPSKVQGRAWCFVLNNPRIEDYVVVTSWKGFCESGYKQFRMCMGQLELGHGTATTPGTLHFQGYCEFLKPKRLSFMRKLFRKGAAHWERRRKSQGVCIAYHSKVDTRVVDDSAFSWNFGVEAKTLCSDDLTESIFAGASAKELALEFPKQFLRNSKGILALREITQDARDFEPEVFIFWGNTGTGKSSYAHEQYPHAFNVCWPAGSRWWFDGYDHETVLICDEFSHQIKLQTMLRFLDRYQFRVELKGSYTEMNSKIIVIITNLDPMDWYPSCPQVVRAALHRRIKEYAMVYHFTDDDYEWSEDGPPAEKTMDMRWHDE